MKKLVPLVVTFVWVIFADICYAKEPIEFTVEFFKMVEAGKISEAYDQLFVGSQIPKQKPQAVDLLKRQTSSGLPLYGKILGHEKIREERIGKSIVRLVYILKSEQAPTTWEFYFYKPKNNWFLSNVIFNDQFQLLHKVE